MTHTALNLNTPLREALMGHTTSPCKRFLPLSKLATSNTRCVVVVVLSGCCTHLACQVTPRDLLYIDSVKCDINTKLALRQVLLLGSPSETVVGRPFIPQAHVQCVVEEQFLDAKVQTVFWRCLTVFDGVNVSFTTCSNNRNWFLKSGGVKTLGVSRATDTH